MIYLDVGTLDDLHMTVAPSISLACMRMRCSGMAVRKERKRVFAPDSSGSSPRLAVRTFSARRGPGLRTLVQLATESAKPGQVNIGLRCSHVLYCRRRHVEYCPRHRCSRWSRWSSSCTCYAAGLADQVGLQECRVRLRPLDCFRHHGCLAHAC